MRDLGIFRRNFNPPPLWVGLGVGLGVGAGLELGVGLGVGLGAGLGVSSSSCCCHRDVGLTGRV